MKITGQDIRHVNTIAHDGKILVLGTAADGTLYYTVKRSGFEDTALAEGGEMFGFEPWQALRLGESVSDPSVVAREQATLADGAGNLLLRSVYGASDEVVKSADAPVQLVSAAGHLYVLRQSRSSGRILVNRFVLDGLENQLVPKLEVRFRRSKQRFVPHESAKSNTGSSFDNLDYRDMDGNGFFEPALELGFAGEVKNGWFSAVLVPTAEGDRFRWHIFVHDSGEDRLVVYTVGSGADGWPDVKDDLVLEPDPTDPERAVHRSIPGIVRRSIDLQGYQVVGGPSATTYDVQVERITDVGPQLVREVVRLMLAVPVTGAGETKTAVIDFALAADGTISQLSDDPQSEVLRSSAREVVTSLSLLDDIKEIALAQPPPSGIVAATERGVNDRLQVRSKEALGPGLAAGGKVALRGTQSYDGHARVATVDGAKFTVDAEIGEAGVWEVVDDAPTGLVFDNMIVGCARTADGKLEILCPAHDLKVGDEVQIAGTHAYDGTFVVQFVDDGARSFVLDAPFFTGMAANLSKVIRRGLRMNGGPDRIETPDLEILPPSASRRFGRTFSAWVRVDAAGTGERGIIEDSGGMTKLAVGGDGRVGFDVRLSDGTTVRIDDDEPVVPGTWTHFAGSLEHPAEGQGPTQLTLYRDGTEVAEALVDSQGYPQIAPPARSDAALARALQLDGTSFIELPPFATPDVLTVSVWAQSATPTWSRTSYFAGKRLSFALQSVAGGRKVSFFIDLDGLTWWIDYDGVADIQQWHCYTGTFDGSRAIFYVDGREVGRLERPGAVAKAESTAMTIGHDPSEGPQCRLFEGRVADVQVWSVARSQADIEASMYQRLTGRESGLVGYWPLDSAEAYDRSPGKRPGSFRGQPAVVSVTSAFTIGKGFQGELADVQIWNRARTAADVKATMHLQLSGEEQGLVADYRMGAIVYEESGPIVPDFSHFGRNGVVHGSPYAGARQLQRRVASGEAFRYASDELIAVSQRGVYEESFEFRLMPATPAVDPNDVDGRGKKLFEFRYWGKSSRGSKVVIEVPAESVTMRRFEALGDRWYRASCRVIVPDGISVLRAFEVSSLAGSWSTMDVRKHHIRSISDAVTRDRYADRVALETLAVGETGGSSVGPSMQQQEDAVAVYEARISSIEAHLEVALNEQRYRDELEAVGRQLSALKQSRLEAQRRRQALLDDTNSYWLYLRAKHSGKVADAYRGKNDYRLEQWGRVDGHDQQLFHLKDVGEGWFKIYCRFREGYPLTPSGKYVDLVAERTDDSQRWRLVDCGDGFCWIVNSSDKALDVDSGSTKDKAWILCWAWHSGANQRWARDRTDELTPSASVAIQKEVEAVAALDELIRPLEEHVAWLTRVLSSGESIEALEKQLDDARKGLAVARLSLATMNTSLLAALSRPAPAAMPVVVTDARGLVTTGAVLDFAEPTGRVRLFAGCEGDVRLAYLDTLGRLRATLYDATADGRNAAFEQWVPDAARACADVRGRNDAITLDRGKAVTLHAGGWTCEAWIQYPLATQDDGTAYAMNAVVGGPGGDLPLVVRGGNRLGIVAEGWFFDSGVDLGQVVAAGWHHLAVSTSGTKTSFYADGRKISSRITQQAALRFSSSTADHVLVPLQAAPTNALTVSVWARSTSATWGSHAVLIAKRDSFVLDGVAGTNTIRLQMSCAVSGSHACLAAVDDVQGWHLYTGTFDGKRMRLYVDGRIVAETILPSVDSLQQTAAAPIYVGHANQAYFDGDIATVALWSRALTMNEVREDLLGPRQGSEAGLVGLWSMATVEDGETLKIKDLTAGACHGEVLGAPQDAMISTLREMSVEVLGNVPGGGSPVGRLAEVRLWSVRLGDAEIAASSLAVPTGNEPGLAAYWPLDEADGPIARDRSAGGEAHGAMGRARWAVCSANLGNPGSKVLGLQPRGSAYVRGPAISLASKSFTIELWARRSEVDQRSTQFLVSMGANGVSTWLHLGFRANDRFTLGFGANDLDGPACGDRAWHHWAATYDASTRTQRIHRDGELVASRANAAPFVGSGPFDIGASAEPSPFVGDLAEVRVWDSALTADEIRAGMRRRASGSEPGLLACYPLDALEDGRVFEQRSGTWAGVLMGVGGRLPLSTSLPMVGADHLVVSEYSSVELGDDGLAQPMMRRFYGYASGGDVELRPELRVEALTLQWVGNTQIDPTLLGYIEGPPPVPSENLTEDEDGYAGATSVTLRQTHDTAYAWVRNEAIEESFSLDSFTGVEWEMQAGVGVTTKIAEGKIGFVGQINAFKNKNNETGLSAASSLAMTDSLALRGKLEEQATLPALGRRWIPKNVGYALVLSGMGDVFVTKLSRSGRMVSYDVRPVEGVPLDINTITFLINPAYTLNGSLDGMVGSAPATPTFHAHVPALRAQHGSLYPASYFRLKEAYALKEAIDRQDKERETFFYNCDVYNAKKVDKHAGQTPTSGVLPPVTPSGDLETLEQETEAHAQAVQSEAEKRDAMIAARSGTVDAQVRAKAGFRSWQTRMEKVLVKAGKHNIVNTYVWDGDGGLRAEEQSFASTVEHSVSMDWGSTGGGGLLNEIMAGSLKSELSLVSTTGGSSMSGKTESQAKSLELTVDLGGVESSGITDLADHPLKPGEKVDRYRFMSFYLEGSTDHFSAFFGYVVDPEWLASNDEEARALRQAQKRKPSKCWRVLHRVTYVERPALKGFGSA